MEKKGMKIEIVAFYGAIPGAPRGLSIEKICFSQTHSLK